MQKSDKDLRDWSLIIGTGKGATNGKGVGHVKFYSCRKQGGGCGKSFSHAWVGGGGGGRGGYNKFWSNFCHIEEGGGGTKSFHSLKGCGGGVQKVLPCFEGGANSFGPATFPFCSPPSPIL